MKPQLGPVFSEVVSNPRCEVKPRRYAFEVCVFCSSNELSNFPFRVLSTVLLIGMIITLIKVTT